jgi:hypothetical protein
LAAKLTPVDDRGAHLNLRGWNIQPLSTNIQLPP